MNFTATADELDTLQQAHPDVPFMVMAQDRVQPISMRDAISAHWASEGPVAVGSEEAQVV